MRTLLFGLAFAAGFATTTYAQNAVNIVSPANGGEYPPSVGNPTQIPIWVPFSFNTLCFHQLYHVDWYLDGQLRGSSDQANNSTVHYDDDVAPGDHVFEVRGCENASVSFTVKTQ